MIPLGPRFLRAAALSATLGLFLMLLLGLVLAQRCSGASAPAFPKLTSSASVLRPTPNVLIAVRDLARLESASFHMERVIDLSEKQSHLFGLLETEDAILLVAVADISAGVDLSQLTAADIESDPATGRVRLTLPAAEVFHTALDAEKSYVHTRRTGVLARRQENLETRARLAAERALLEAAKEAGILARAEENAQRIVEHFIRSLGHEQVEVRVKPAATP